MKNHVARREREQKELRYRILRAAEQLFLAGGESAVTLRAVAKKVEFSPTAIYLHFSNKEALVDEVCKAEMDRHVRLMQAADSLPDAMGRLRKVAALYVDFGLQYPEHYKVLFMRGGSHRPEPARPSRSSASKPRSQHSIGANPDTATSKEVGGIRPFDYLQNAVFKAMAAGCFKAEYRDVSLLAQMIWSCLHGVVGLHLVRAQHSHVAWKPVQNILEASLECLFNGLTVPSHQAAPSWWR